MLLCITEIDHQERKLSIDAAVSRGALFLNTIAPPSDIRHPYVSNNTMSMNVFSSVKAE